MTISSPAARVLAALVAGLALGAVLASTRSPLLAPAVAIAAPVGAMWVNAIQATVIPLVVSLLVTGVATAAGTRAVGRMGAEALLLFIALLTISAIFVALVAAPLVARMPVSAATSAALRGAAGMTAAPVTHATLPGVGEWLASLVTANPIASAADGALLPLVLFTLAFALAVTRIPKETRTLVTGFFQGIAAAMLVLVRWILWLAPLGVFALSITLGASTGFGLAATLLSFVALVAATCAVLVAGLYTLAVLGGHVALGRFARAALPAQAVAFSTRSSLAALPPMVERAESELDAPSAITGFFLPLAVSTFKQGATIAIITGTLFLARIYDVALSPAQLASIAVAAVVLSFGIPGIPGGLILVIAPVLAGIGIPAQGLGVLLAVDTIPEMFRTVTNVTADLAAATVLARRARERGDAEDVHDDS